MQRIFVIICLLIAIAFTSSCGHFERDRKYFMYYKVLAVNDTLDNMTREWHRLLDKALKDKSFHDLGSHRLKMGQFLSRNRAGVADLAVNSDAAIIINRELVFLSNRATIVSEIYTKFEPFNTMTPDGVINKQLQTITNDFKNEMAVNAAIKRGLSVFARKNKLKVKR